MNRTNTAVGQKAISSTKTLLALAFTLATLLAAAAPGPTALAQQSTDVVDEESAAQEAGATRVGGPAMATGVLGRAAPHSPDPTPVYVITDEETGTPYELVSGFVDLEQYVGERITIQGVPVPGPGDPNKPPLLNVTQVEPADGDDDPPAVNDKATLSFELTVFGDPPDDVAFYGNVETGEGGPGLFVPLSDPDQDRVYTGTTTVDIFGPGPRPVPPGVEPVSLPVQIVQDSEVIKDFGSVKLDGDKTFEASVSFPVDDCPIISPTPEQCGDGSSGGSDGSGGGSPNSGGSSGADSGSSGSSGGGSSGDNSTSSGSVDSGSGSAGSSGGGVPGEMANGLRGVLPSTGGGMALWVLGAGALLIGGGLLVRRALR
jgi:LPXTG-motif cell wall-anchored protein